MSRTNDFIRLARERLPKALVESDPREMSVFASDWTRREGNPGVVFLPRTTEEVSQVLKLCYEQNYPVVPSGGRTGLAGGAVPLDGQAVLSLSKLNQIHPVDTLGFSVRVGAGAVTQAVHDHCRREGLTWPIDLAAKGSSQIGGNLSTNAGGVRVIRYGMARRWVTGIEAVTMNGEVLQLNKGLEKNNTGYDLVQLICGSEGTLAVVTEATLKLTRIPEASKVFLFGVNGLKNVETLFREARKGPFHIVALEFFSRVCALAVKEQLGIDTRFNPEPEFFLLMEVEALAGKPLDEPLTDWLGHVLEAGHVADGLLAQSEREAQEVWKLREGITESLQKKSKVKKFDIAVAPHRIAELLGEIQTWFTGPTGKQVALGLDYYLFGHWGDGSPHLNLVKRPSVDDAQFEKDYVTVEKWVFELLKKFGGSVSAEHGVGLLKKSWLPFSRSPEEMRLFREIKKAFDPKGLLNPGKVLE